MIETGPTQRTGNLLRLFHQDLSQEDRVEAFRQAGDQLREEIEALASPENVALINDKYDVTFVLNSHGGSIDACQSARAVDRPFVTFVENVGDQDVSTNTLFGVSLESAFAVMFEGLSPSSPIASTSHESHRFGYWRDRGLLAKGSLIVPVDIRHYSKRLLDALIGSDYDQEYLNRSVSIDEIQGKTYEEVCQSELNRGKLILHSNALRELTTTKQIIESLLDCLEVPSGPGRIGEQSMKKVRAIRNQRLAESDKLPAYIVYGAGHHTMIHIFRKLGINAQRIFPGSSRYPSPIKFAGTGRDQFFGAHPFEVSEATLDTFAVTLVMEALLWAPLIHSVDSGYVPANEKATQRIHLQIARLARRLASEDPRSIFDNFSADNLSVISILTSNGIDIAKTH